MLSNYWPPSSITLFCHPFGAKPELASAKACPLICKAADYMTCDSTGEERLSAPCNCYLARKGCTIYYSYGTVVIC
ncbi:hypothetical protein CsSME_00015424 [Camellia sinensis var. sinensis]